MDESRTLPLMYYCSQGPFYKEFQNVTAIFNEIPRKYTLISDEGEKIKKDMTQGEDHQV